MYKRRCSMRSIILFVLMLLISSIAHAEWEQRFTTNFVEASVHSDGKIWLGHINGLTNYDPETEEQEYFSSVNSVLPGNRINSFLTIDENKVMLSTARGPAMIINGELTVSDPICHSYKENDSRYLYFDEDGNIWTFTTHKVLKYDGNNWTEYNLENQISYKFDIHDIYFHKGKVWVKFNDNTKTNSTFYGGYHNDYFKFAIIGDSGVEELLNSNFEFPFRQGSVSLVSAGEELWYKNGDGIYIYKDGNFSLLEMNFTEDKVSPHFWQELIRDKSGNIWFMLENESLNKNYPVSYNIETGEFTEYLADKDLGTFYLMYLFDGSTIVTSNSSYLCMIEAGETEIIEDKELGFGDDKRMYAVNSFGGKKYFMIIDYSGVINMYSYYCLDDDKEIPVYKNELDYTSITELGLNAFDQGMFSGREGTNYVSDTGYVRPDLYSNVVNIKAGPDGNVYFANLRYDDKTNNLATWEGTELKVINTGFADKNRNHFITYDFSDNKIFFLGEYEYEEDSVNTFISIYNSETKQLITYDKNNSCMPDYYFESQGYFRWARDTVARSISVGKDNNVWCLTSESLIEFSPGGCNLFKIPRDTAGYAVYSGEISYDDYTGQILLGTMFYFDIESGEYHPVIYENAGFEDNITKVKKLVDGNVWASGDEGYLYRYWGDGKFKIYDMNIHGRQNLGIRINDFSMDVHGKLHLGTEIGLFSGEGFLSVPAETAEGENVIVYPNPFIDMLYIARDGVSSYQVFDILGNKAGSGEHTSIVSGNKLSPGIYFLRIFYFDGTHDTVKIIKNE